jgi:CRISPR/Cas system Type II protein with McrA/HNH and RuvC-like nuclease domain
MNNIKVLKKNWRIKQKELGLCSDCKNPSNGKYRCKKCQERNRNSSRKYGNERVKNGKCYTCTNEAIPGNTSCLKHWFKKMCFDALGTKKDADMIISLLEKQNHICIYTGEKLIPGINASIDHIVPVSRGGENKIENLQWVTKRINTIKNDLTHQEFIELCGKIWKKFH